MGAVARLFQRFVYLWVSGSVCVASVSTSSRMSKRTALNEPFRGLVESMSIPVELHERDGRQYASFGSVVPIHCCTPEQVRQYAATTHHYCDLFSEQLFAPLGELAYVRLDQDTAEKVFINRTKRILIVSSDGQLAQWRCAPSFESANRFLAGTPIVNKEGELVSLVTARWGNHYAVSNFEGDGGYFESPLPWLELELAEGAMVYGARAFSSREELRAYIGSLPPAAVGVGDPAQPVLVRAREPRLALVARAGRQLAHHYLHAVHALRVQYL